MLFNKAIATMSLLTSCLAASVDLWAGPERSIDPRDEPIYQPIEPEEIIARLGTTPQEFEPEERHWGIVSSKIHPAIHLYVWHVISNISV